MRKLTTLAVKTAKPGRYYDGAGLILLVKPTGARSWVLRIQSKGKRRDFGLGSAREISLSEARERASETRKQVRRGIDPLEARKASQSLQESSPTFREASIAAHADQNSSWKNAKHRAQWLSTLETYAFPTLGNEPVDQIGAAIIVKTLRPIWLAKSETARRVRQRICAVLDWSQAKGWRTTDAPTGAISKGLPRQTVKTKHFAAMRYEEVPTLLAEIAKPLTVSKLALQFLILTAARSGEVRGATWSEIDLGAALWTIPASRMKSGNEHVVPLTPGAILMLQLALSARRGGEPDLVFPGQDGRPLSDMTLTKVLRAIKTTPATVHGFRSSFRDWAAECTDYSDAVVEAALAHTNRNRVESAYRRTIFLDKRMLLMTDWDMYLYSEEGARLMART